MSSMVGSVRWMISRIGIGRCSSGARRKAARFTNASALATRADSLSVMSACVLYDMFALMIFPMVFGLNLLPFRFVKPLSSSLAAIFR